MLFKGETIKLSLPVKVFDSISQLEKICQVFSNLQLLDQASLASNKMEKLQCVMTLLVTGVYYSVTMKKPFNPYLGETCQGTYADGTKIYIEHIQHDPPLDAFLIVNEEKKIKVHGKLKTHSKLSPNEFVLKLQGVIVFDFDGSLIYAELA